MVTFMSSPISSQGRLYQVEAKGLASNKINLLRQTVQNVASDQRLHGLHTGLSIRNKIKNKKGHLTALNIIG